MFKLGCIRRWLLFKAIFFIFLASFIPANSNRTSNFSFVLKNIDIEYANKLAQDNKVILVSKEEHEGFDTVPYVEKALEISDRIVVLESNDLLFSNLKVPKKEGTVYLKSIRKSTDFSDRLSNLYSSIQLSLFNAFNKIGIRIPIKYDAAVISKGEAISADFAKIYKNIGLVSFLNEESNFLLSLYRAGFIGNLILLLFIIDAIALIIRLFSFGSFENLFRSLVSYIILLSNITDKKLVLVVLAFIMPIFNFSVLIFVIINSILNMF